MCVFVFVFVFARSAECEVTAPSLRRRQEGLPQTFELALHKGQGVC